jgi:hypothetical protein
MCIKKRFEETKPKIILVEKNLKKGLRPSGFDYYEKSHKVKNT